jgi:hypothetical protein
MDFFYWIAHFPRQREKKKRRKKEIIIGAKLSTGPLYVPPHLKEDVMIFLTLSCMGNFRHLNPLHVSLEACEVA